MRKSDLIALREATPDDTPFIIATWKHGLYFGVPFFRHMHRKTFDHHMVPAISNALNHSATSCFVACLVEDPNVIIGYSVISQSTILDWVYVKANWRQIGVARSLVPESITKCTMLTPLGRQIKPKAWEYNPFLFNRGNA